MKQSIWVSVVRFCVIALTLVTGRANAQQAWEGEGLKLVVTSLATDPNVAGEIQLAGAAYPFTGSIVLENGQRKLVGTFTAKGATFPFTTQQPVGQDHTIFTTGTRTYKLLPVMAAKNDNPLDNPLDTGDGKVANPLDQSPTDNKPKEPNPLDADANAVAGARDEVIRLKRAVFNDVSMGGLPAYSMLVPDGWNVNGRIEWSVGTTTYPQKIIAVTAPDGRQVQFLPQWKFALMEVDPRWAAERAQLGLPPENPPSNGPPPQNIGDWLVSYLPTVFPAMQNVQVVSQRPDEEMQKTMAEVHQKFPALNVDREEFVYVTISYDASGVRVREELRVMYCINQPMVVPTSRIIPWTVHIIQAIATPEANFHRDKAMLYSLAGSLRPLPNWWTASQDLLTQLANGRAKANLEIIQQMGAAARNRQPSDDQMTAFKNSMATSDRIHDKNIDRIYEVQPYKDVDGGTVKLPIHYHHAYSDGKDNYILTNKRLERPGDFQELQQQ